jgi:hypothetical protein
MIPSEDKRYFSRMHTDCKLAYKPVGTSIPLGGSCVNLSGSGILFRSASPVEPGKAIEVHIRPTYKVTPPLTAFVEVVRCSPISEGAFEIAGAIKGIKDE